MNKVYLGKIINTHGIKGELKLLSNFEYLDLVLKPNFKLYINKQEYLLTSFRYHQEYILIKINNWDNINDVLFLKGLDVYINRDDLNLNNHEYLLHDLYDMTVMEEEKIIGKVKEVLEGKKYNYIRISYQNTSFLVPLINNYIIDVNIEKKIIYIRNSQSFIDLGK